MNPKVLAHAAEWMLGLLRQGSLSKEQVENQEFHFGPDAFQMPTGYSSKTCSHRWSYK